MLDIKFIREHKDLIEAGARKKHINFDVKKLIEVDSLRRELMSEVESLREKQNDISSAIAHMQNPDERTHAIEESKALKEQLQGKEVEMKKVIEKWQGLMLQVPNLPDISVPEGVTDEENKEIKVWGEPSKFTFEPKNHIDLMKGLDLVEFERGTKVAGFRGYFLKNEAVSLSFALWQYVLAELTKKGFTPLMAPSLVKKEPFYGTGYLPQGEEDLYKTQDDMYLAGTAEVPTMACYMDEVLDKSDLPRKFVSFSPCFRREAGSYGKDTKGLIRVHEFFKLEQVMLCEASHQVSVEHHEELTQNAEEIIQALEIPYHVVVNCGGDLGLGQVKKYDIEVWVPSEGRYRESHSSSYFHDFQTRRLNIRYKDTDGKLRYAHSLNNTAIASPRILTAIIENYQQEDGTIRVPTVLQDLMGKEVISRS